ncbi:MAG: hypothetical protein K6L74_06580 [Neptuniibacter sp.]
MKIYIALFTAQAVANDGTVNNYALCSVSLDTNLVEFAHLLLNHLRP